MTNMLVHVKYLSHFISLFLFSKHCLVSQHICTMWEYTKCKNISLSSRLVPNLYLCIRNEVVGIRAVCCAFLLFQVSGHFIIHCSNAVSDSASTLTASRVKKLCAKTLLTHCLNNLIITVCLFCITQISICLVTGFSFLKRTRQELLLNQPFF